MAHFQLENAIAAATRMDVPIQRGPLMRWQRKAAEAGIRSLSLSDSNVNSCGLAPGSARTPCSGNSIKTPLSSRTNTPLCQASWGGSLDSLTPQSKARAKKPSTGKTPKKGATENTTSHSQDRYIPCRSTTDFDAGHHMLVVRDEDGEELSPGKRDYQQAMSEALGENRESKILSYQTKAPAVKEGHMNNLKVLYSAAPSTGPKATNIRQIPKQPERIMDTPNLIDDYYLNLMDWSSNNLLTLAMGPAVYIWNATNGTVSQLLELGNPDEYISCVKWIKEGNILAVGINLGVVQLWDIEQQKLLRTMGGHAARVGALSWNTYILSSGSRTGAIHHHDVRVAGHHVATLSAHAQEVCGLAWSPDGRHLASGANDNMLCIWDAQMSSQEDPLQRFTLHQSAVKALSWCPWQAHLLASGGGTADRHIRFWNVATGACLQSVDTNSQVCSILWSAAYKELISGHGFSQNQLTIWKYPKMSRVADLTGHESRILDLSMSPDGSTVASAGADETLRLWKCFPVEKPRKTSTNKSSKDMTAALTRGIR